MHRQQRVLRIEYRDGGGRRQAVAQRDVSEHSRMRQRMDHRADRAVCRVHRARVLCCHFTLAQGPLQHLGRFLLQRLHPGHTLDDVRDQTGVDFDAPATGPPTRAPDAQRLALLRGPVATQIADVYPGFAQQVFGTVAA